MKKLQIDNISLTKVISFVAEKKEIYEGTIFITINGVSVTIRAG
jgi:hypothetical protein